MSLTIDLARRILEASKQRANELRSPVSIAIVDAGGHLVLAERMMAPYGWATIQISIAKATTSVMFNQSTDAVAQWGAAIPGFASSMAEMSQGKFIMAAGGWPLRLHGATIGGIGVSGGNAPGRDDDIARAGVAMIEALGAPIPPAYQPVQPAPAFAQSSALPLQPAPTYPSQPYQPLSQASQESAPPSSSHSEIGQNTANQDAPYSEEPSTPDQYSESSKDQ